MVSRSRGALVPLVCLLLGECAVFDAPSPQWVHSMRPPSGIQPNMIQIDAHLLERPLGDDFIDKEIWKQADQMLLALPKQESLHLNGMRVGQVMGLTPAKLQELLQSPRWCLDPRRRIIPSGESISQVMSPVLKECAFEIQTEKKTEEVKLEQAKFFLEVTATLTKDNRTLLKFTPKVETGETQYLPYKPSVEEGAWKLSMEKPCRRFPELSWEIAVQPNELLIIGGNSFPENSIGQRIFVQDDGQVQVQRLLVLRTARSVGTDSGTPTLEDFARTASPASLALQAPVPAFRGSGVK